jgi:3'(2'), 5'-bisphosphate nucleotidase
MTYPTLKELKFFEKIMIHASKLAGDYIFKAQEKVIVETKVDSSPVTNYDKKANDIICAYLNQHLPEIPIISEETKNNFEEAQKHDFIFFIDPIDGTKEFIAGLDEFVVSIGLIYKNYPVVGVINAPKKNKIYTGIVTKERAKELENINFSLDDLVEKFKNLGRPVRALVSRSNKSQKPAFLKDIDVEEIPMGSALKFCAIAEGEADLYYREEPLKEWDTCAGQAIVEGKDGPVFDIKSQKRVNYSLLFSNYGFVSLAS